MKRPFAVGFRFLKAVLFGGCAVLLSAATAFPQEQNPGPLTPPPEHKVTRQVGVSQPEAPPDLPLAQIVKGFVQKEDAFAAARGSYGYTKTVRIQEFAPDGRPSGEFTGTYEGFRGADGKLYEKVVGKTDSNLQYLQVVLGDVQKLSGVPAFPVTSATLAKYDIKYMGTETLDEIDCYILEVKPRAVDRQHPLFDGIIWVDQKFLEAVKTYGKWVTDLGDYRDADLPFTLFETYREQVDGKCWLPNYMRADDFTKLKDRNLPIRVIVKWSNFKPLPPAAPQAAPAPAAAPAAAKP